MCVRARLQIRKSEDLQQRLDASAREAEEREAALRRQVSHSARASVAIVVRGPDASLVSLCARRPRTPR